jgi:hypothetical protein
MGALAGALLVALHCHIEGWKEVSCLQRLALAAIVCASMWVSAVCFLRVVSVILPSPLFPELLNGTSDNL